MKTNPYIKVIILTVRSPHEIKKEHILSPHVLPRRPGGPGRLPFGPNGMFEILGSPVLDCVDNWKDPTVKIQDHGEVRSVALETNVSSIDIKNLTGQNLVGVQATQNLFYDLETCLPLTY